LTELRNFFFLSMGTWVIVILKHHSLFYDYSLRSYFNFKKTFLAKSLYIWILRRKKQPRYIKIGFKSPASSVERIARNMF
jgi:hypothetical protein